MHTSRSTARSYTTHLLHITYHTLMHLHLHTLMHIVTPTTHSFIYSLSPRQPRPGNPQKPEPSCVTAVRHCEKPTKLGRMEADGSWELCQSLTLTRGLRLPTDTLPSMVGENHKYRCTGLVETQIGVGRAGCLLPHMLPLHLLWASHLTSNADVIVLCRACDKSDMWGPVGSGVHGTTEEPEGSVSHILPGGYGNSPSPLLGTRGYRACRWGPGNQPRT